MAVYSIFVALGLEITVRPVLEYSESWFEEEEQYWSEDDSMSLVSNPEMDIFDRAFVGDNLTEVVVSCAGDEGDNYRDIIDSFDAREMGVNWLTRRSEQNRNIGMVHLTVCSLPNFVKKC